MIDLSDERIFGNDAGDDEDINVLNKYFLEQESFNRFYDPTIPFRIVTARKGTGKSALLRRCKTIAERTANKNITLSVKGADIRPNVSNASEAQNLIDAWKQRLCTRINREIGSRIKFSASDDSITLVEASELDGFKERNVVSALADRFAMKINSVGTSLSLGKLAAANDPALLERYSKNNDHVFWLFVDDIDATFQNTPENKALLGAFFSACRDLIQRVTGLVIRCSVRTDVWALTHQSDESLDKCEQYLFNLRWDNTGVENILLNKVHSYFTSGYVNGVELKCIDIDEQKKEALRLVFPAKYPWGKNKSISPEHYISLMSQGRPRWTSKLCRAAALRAHRNGRALISEEEMQREVNSYSSKRRQDLAGEHSHEYRDFNSLLQIFFRWNKKFSTQELIKRISDLHIKRIPGTSEKPDPIYLANLLYRSGFINATRDNGKGKNSYFEFEDRPNLLTSRGDLDEGCSWEIPMFLRKEFDI